MTIRSVSLQRNIPARKDDGTMHHICLATVGHENGHMETVAINEELIKFAGQEMILTEIERALKR